MALAVMVSSIGALNGWTLLMGQVPMAAAQDRLFPAIFARLSARDVPATGIVLSALLATLLVLVQAWDAPNVQAIYHLIVSLSTMTAVILYAFCALAAGIIAARRDDGSARLRRVGAVEVVAFVFAIFTIYGCGPTPVLYGLILLLLGTPMYVWQRRRTLLPTLSED